MEEFKKECYIQNTPNGFWLWLVTGYREEKFICSVNDAEQANLMCEALNVKIRTDLTPEQMEKRISDLEARLKESNSLLSRAYGHVYEDNELADKIELHLTKEKTK